MNSELEGYGRSNGSGYGDGYGYGGGRTNGLQRIINVGILGSERAKA